VTNGDAHASPYFFVRCLGKRSLDDVRIGTPRFDPGSSGSHPIEDARLHDGMYINCLWGLTDVSLNAMKSRSFFNLCVDGMKVLLRLRLIGAI
jgi:hypothetical protein